MFKNGSITCCPVCKNEDEKNNLVIGLSKEFGTPFIECKICKQCSVRDLTHGIENDHIPSNVRRNSAYREKIKSLYGGDVKILEIGPGDYKLSNGLSQSGREVTTIDVGKSFLIHRHKNISSFCVDSPETPQQIFDVSTKIYEISKESSPKGGFDLGISLHSWEHSPDPVTMIYAISKHCKDFVIEVPNGDAGCHRRGRPAKTVKNETVVGSNYLEKHPETEFPIMPKDAEGRSLRGSGKGALVGGHYQIFCPESIEWLARNLLDKNRNYYIGGSIYENDRLSICISTKPELVARKKGIPFLVVQNKLTF